MSNNKKIKTEKVEQKQCKGFHCTTMLPYGDKHILCEKCRGKYADGIKQGGKVLLGAISFGVALASAGKINIKKD